MIDDADIDVGKTPFSRRMIFPGLYDRKLKKSWQGDVVDIAGKKTVVIASVNARTLKEMRALKHHLVDVIRDFYANTNHDTPT